MSDEILFGKLDCNDPEYLAALEKAHEEKYQKSAERKSFEERSNSKDDIA